MILDKQKGPCRVCMDLFGTYRFKTDCSLIYGYIFVRSRFIDTSINTRVMKNTRHAGYFSVDWLGYLSTVIILIYVAKTKIKLILK